MPWRNMRSTRRCLAAVEAQGSRGLQKGIQTRRHRHSVGHRLRTGRQEARRQFPQSRRTRETRQIIMSVSALEETIASHETPGTKFFAPFQVTPELEAEADERISHYPASKRSATLPLLHIVQHKFGYISAAAIDWVARETRSGTDQGARGRDLLSGLPPVRPGEIPHPHLPHAVLRDGWILRIDGAPVRADRHRPLAMRSPPSSDRRFALRKLLGRVRRVPRLLRHGSGLHGQR